MTATRFLAMVVLKFVLKKARSPRRFGAPRWLAVFPTQHAMLIVVLRLWYAVTDAPKAEKRVMMVMLLMMMVVAHSV